MRGSAVVETVKDLIQPVHHRYRSWQATRAHQTPNQTVSPSEGPQHILIVVIDALRPDATDAIPLETTSGIAPAPWTFPSVTSLLTASYPHEHNAYTVIPPEETGPQLPEQASQDSLPLALEAAGYETAAICGFLTPHLALQSWFQYHRVFNQADAESVVTQYRNWRSGRKNTFAYLHLADLHEPLKPPEQYVDNRDVDTSIPNIRTWSEEYVEDFGSKKARQYRDGRLALYRAAGDYVRDTLEQFLTEMKEDTFLVVTGDHGEAHWEHHEIARKFTDSRPAYGVGHGGTPFDMVARVPIAVCKPGGEIVNPCGGWPSLIDIPPTMMGKIGLSHSFDGQDWQRPIPTDRAVICEGSYYGSERKAVYRNNEKLIVGVDDDVVLEGYVDVEENEEELTVVDQAGENLAKYIPEHTQYLTKHRQLA